MKRYIVIKFQFEGIHYCPECDVEGVEFLKAPHRHIFHVEAKKLVTHNNRDVEFIDLEKNAGTYCQTQWQARIKVLRGLSRNVSP